MKFSDITKDANEIQRDQHKFVKTFERIDYPDHFTLESVKERLDKYDISNLPNLQVLADVMVMLCICLAELTTLCITDAGVTGYAKNRDAVYGVVAHNAKNMAHTYTIARECLHHSSDNYTSSVQNYVIINYRPCGVSAN
ncbi:17906_t:CDS:2 [Cetraspora pellucida]|uniref:17906_t:CDS:1 n=1 Tax=Cetraspora pellucida TaxID=1433469 RepID=A0A9N8ZLY1_9GLOM|nr:17906_t:CDS:2 [Cetraspora pellucida]